MKAKSILMLLTMGVIWPSFAGSETAVRTAATDFGSASTTSSGDSCECIPTTPGNHHETENAESGVFRSDDTFGNDSLYTIPGSRITFRPGGAGSVMADGSLSMKYMWWRLRNGPLTIKGHRLDDTAPPLRASIPDGYGDTGFQATSLIFPTPGCWEVSASVGDTGVGESSISFIVDVTLIGDGPCWKQARVPGEIAGTVSTTSWVEETLPENPSDKRVSHVTVILASLGSATTEARCIDVVDSLTELPNDLVTSHNTGVSYSYDLEQEQYMVTWSKSGQTGGPYGPFTLTRGCAPAILEWESSDFLLLQAGCGTFCWYVLVLPLTGSIDDWTKIERPLAFDESRNLLAHYHDKDIIRVKNLKTGQRQEFRTAQECESASGLCVDAVLFTDTSLEYTWRSGTEKKPFSVRLDARLLGH